MRTKHGFRIPAPLFTRLKLPAIAALCLLFSNCAEFPESYENIIQDGKIRPLAIIMEPPEAAPGDTVNISLVMHDAGKEYGINWEVAANYTETNYGYLEKGAEVSEIEAGKDKVSFKYVVPDGKNNPLLKTQLVPDIVVPADQVDKELKALFESEGMDIGKEGITRELLVEFLDIADNIPAEFQMITDEFVGLMLFTAKVRSKGFKLDVKKRLSIRYSNRITTKSHKSNVNLNPAVNAIGLITVDKEGVDDFEDIKDHPSDTLYFSRKAENDSVDLDAIVDTVKISENKTYFLIADTAGMAQKYRSPDGMEHSEQLNYQWFYTNRDVPAEEWDELIELSGSGINGTDNPIVRLRTPKNKKMHNFVIRLVVRDFRAEWGLRNSPGTGYLAVRGYFDYID